jgi:hypothetical protein
MANFAHIEDGRVINVIIATDKSVAEMVTGGICIEYADINSAGIGWTYENNEFLPPVQEVIFNPVVKITSEPTE